MIEKGNTVRVGDKEEEDNAVFYWFWWLAEDYFMIQVPAGGESNEKYC